MRSLNYLFNEDVFDTFNINSVEGRAQAIRSRIQPLFYHYAQQINDQLTDLHQPNLPVHVAKHIRRKVHPAKNTWVAIGGDKRGYKKYPHFQLGINSDYVFIVLAMIENLKGEKAIAEAFKENMTTFEALPSDFIIIPDHTQLPYIHQTEADYHNLFERFEQIKKAELMFGRLAKLGDPVLESQASTSQWLQDTLLELLPIYELAQKAATEMPESNNPQ